MRRARLAAILILAALVAGCTNPLGPGDEPVPYTELEGYARDPTGRNATAWPDLEGATLVLLDNGAFSGTFNEAAAQFESLTKVKITLEDGGDALGALKKLQRSRGSYDLIWGIDNMFLFMAVEKEDLVPYRPALHDRIRPEFVFFGNGTWHATPVDHGYIALNIDPKGGFNESIDNLAEVARYADKLVVQDPRLSSPGLGFLLITIDTFGENATYTQFRYDWREYWRDLFRGPDRNHDDRSDGCVLVVPDWSTAYVQHFSGGYGPANGGLGDRPIVVSYTQSPAIEAFHGRPRADLARTLHQGGAAYHQIQTIAIANGTKNLQAAQAWVEFTLTDYFQQLLPEHDVMYPVVAGKDANATFRGLDPAPGSFRAVEFPQQYLSHRDHSARGSPSNLERWLREWETLYQDTDLNCDL